MNPSELTEATKALTMLSEKLSERVQIIGLVLVAVFLLVRFGEALWSHRERRRGDDLAAKEKSDAIEREKARETRLRDDSQALGDRIDKERERANSRAEAHQARIETIFDTTITKATEALMLQAETNREVALVIMGCPGHVTLKSAREPAPMYGNTEGAEQTGVMEVLGATQA